MAAIHPAAPPKEPPAASPVPRVTHTKIFVRAIRLEAYVGIYAHEQGRTQPLVVDVELDVAVSGFRRLEDTLNYETIVARAQGLAAEGHIGLVESFAERLAGALLEDQRVSRARVRVEKPEALAPAAAAAGVEIIAVRS